MSRDPDPLCGRILNNRYRIRELLGRGGMGAVYEAVDQRLGRTVAVKVIGLSGESLMMRERLRARFQREARAAAALQHPNVVTVHDFGLDEPLGLEFLVMERLYGEDLATRRDRLSVLSPREVQELLRGALRGVAAGHQAGIVHRDLKPGNLFLVAGDDPLDQRVRVLDFGIAQRRSPDSTETRLTVTGYAPLSPAFASPEQLRGDAELTPATDVFSLAATATYLLTGQRVFTPAERAELGEGGIVLARGPRNLDPRVTAALDHVLREALSFYPRQRFQDAGAFLDALEAVSTSLTPVRRPRFARAGAHAGTATTGLREPSATGETTYATGAGKRARTASQPAGMAETTDPGEAQASGTRLGRSAAPGAAPVVTREPSWLRRFGGRRRFVRGGAVVLAAGLTLPLVGWSALRALETSGWGVRQSGTEAMEQCTRLYQRASEAANPAWRAVARACGRASESGDLVLAERLAALQRRVHGLRASGQLLEAERAARVWVQLQPRETEPYLQLGEVLQRGGRLEEALWGYRQAQQLSSRNALLSLRSAQVLSEMGRLNDARRELEQARRAEPGIEDTWEYQHQVAGLLFQLQDWEASMHAHRRVTELNPSWADGWGNLALAAHLLGRHQEAVDAYSRALQADPRFFETRPDQRDFWQRSLRRVL
jgi:cytochrome c-type biogenesis protein CcmH/NrfG